MHNINPSATTAHSYWDNSLEPVLTIQSGEAVRYSTLAADWSAVNDADELEKVDFLPSDEWRGHALCGPIAIEGAKAGQVLEVQINAIVPDTRGYNVGGGNPQWEPFRRMGTGDDERRLMNWQIDVEAGTATSATGHRVKITPFMGVLGLAPAEAGRHCTAPPRLVGGNIDCKELVVGTMLYLPIEVDGALFSVGDGHAAQGDGEISGTAIECPMQQVDLTFAVRDDMRLTTPSAKIHGGWMTLGFDEDLDEATFKACNAMLDYMVATYQVERHEALALASVVVDLRVTQIVNGVKGVHAILRDDAIEKA